MSERGTVEAAIRAWEVARATEDAARKAVCEAKAALALATRALDTAETREDEARRELARMMPPGVGGGCTYEDAKGLIVDDRVYFKVDDQEIRSIGIANQTPGLPIPLESAEESGGVWHLCNVKCPGCEEVGRVHYRPLQYDYRFQCDRCGHAWRSGTVDERGVARERACGGDPGLGSGQDGCGGGT